MLVLCPPPGSSVRISLESQGLSELVKYEGNELPIGYNFTYDYMMRSFLQYCARNQFGLIDFGQKQIEKLELYEDKINFLVNLHNCFTDAVYYSVSWMLANPRTVERLIENQERIDESCPVGRGPKFGVPVGLDYQSEMLHRTDESGAS